MISEYEQNFYINKKTDLIKFCLHIASVIKDLDKAKRWQVIIKPLYNMRSVQQNAYYWGKVLPCICEWYLHTHGRTVSPKFVHEKITKILYCPYQVEVDCNGNDHKIYVTTSELKTYEFNDMFEMMAADFVERGCYIPPPDPDWRKNERRPKEQQAA